MYHCSERRKNRSRDPITALHYQLSALREQGKFDAVVLADDSGCVVAGAGAWPVCEELAALAPYLVKNGKPLTLSQTEQFLPLDRASVVRVNVDGLEVLLCTKGGGRGIPKEALRNAATGCRRILGEG